MRARQRPHQAVAANSLNRKLFCALKQFLLLPLLESIDPTNETYFCDPLGACLNKRKINKENNYRKVQNIRGLRGCW